MHKYTKTSGLDYLFTKRRMARRQNNILTAFQDRARSAGSSGIILNTEELATVYHFPTIMVKAPLVARTQAKRASAPISLPIEHAPRTLRMAVRSAAAPAPVELPVSPTAQSSPQQPEVPGNLPFI